MRKQRIILKYRVQRSLFWLVAGYIAIVDKDIPAIGALEAADHPQSCCFATTRRAEHRKEFAGFNFKRNIVDH